MGSVSGLQSKRVYLDANIFIYAVERVEPYIKILTALFKAIETREIDAFTCGLSLTETISKPIQTQNLKSKEAYIKAITGSPHLTCLRVTNGVFLEAANLRATTSAKTPDSIHLASALAAGCDVFLTNDKGVPEHPAITRCLLSEYL